MNFSTKGLGFILLIASLTACGSGSDSPPVQSTATFSVDAAYKNNLSTARDLAWSLTGTINANSLSGSGTLKKSGLSAGTFNGAPVQMIAAVVSGTIIAAGKSAPLNTNTTTYYDANLKAVGSSGTTGTGYQTETLSALPVAAKIGDTGNLSSAIGYSDAARLIKASTSTSTWALSADTPNTAILTITTVLVGKTSADNATLTEVLKTTPSGVTTPVSLESNANNQIVKFNF
jgi:hypothetical protein